MSASKRLLPTGQCFCGCDEETPRGSFFAPGHDKRAEGAVIRMRHGGVAEFVVAHGYGPGGKNLFRDYERWKRARGEA